MKKCAIILAAGRGSRMGDLTKYKPKGLIGPPGCTTVESQLKNLNKVGVDEIIIVTGYLAKDFDQLNIHTIFNGEWNSSNMVYSLSKAFERAKRFDQILVSYADIFYQIEALESILQHNDDIALTYDVNWLSNWQARFEDPLVDAETFRMDKSGYLIAIGQKPDKIEEIEGQFMGLLSFSQSGFKTFFNFIFNLHRDKQKKIDMTSALSLFKDTEKTRIKCVPFSGTWGEIDSRSDYELYFQNK